MNGHICMFQSTHSINSLIIMFAVVTEKSRSDQLQYKWAGSVLNCIAHDVTARDHHAHSSALKDLTPI